MICTPVSSKAKPMNNNCLNRSDPSFSCAIATSSSWVREAKGCCPMKTIMRKTK